MSNFVFTPPTREARKARVVLDGPTGSGRTWTALRMAQGFGGSIGLVDTGRGAAALYSRDFDFLHLPLNTFDPRVLIEVIAAAAEQRIGTLIIDSASPFWASRGGLLALVDQAAKENHKGNNSLAWNQMRPLEWDLMDALMSFPGHLIVTLQVRTEYLVQEIDGQATPIKVGGKPEQRDNFDADFLFSGSLNMAHVLTVTKSRVVDVPVGSMFPQPGEDLAKVIAEWLADGVEVPDSMDYRDQALDPSLSVDDLRDLFRQAKKADLLRAAVLDENGVTVPLGSLITGKAEAAQQPARRQQGRPQTEQQPAAAGPGEQGGGEYTPDDRKFVAQATNAIAISVLPSAHEDLSTIENNLREAKEAGELSQKDYAHLYRVLEQRRTDLGLPHGQPHAATGQEQVA
ncbi:AAA family ATPase [Nonomuraea dietziae]|uniref:AAA family ATPase n=1 Tax=Nonomuraea dietziae TaxID=65515 RepID=UPI0033FD255D